MQKAWNIPNLPVYSLATYNNNRVNMNICTYVSAVSMKPKLYTVAIYNSTKTHDNIDSSDFAVLQLLHFTHFNLIKKLGQSSGWNLNKQDYLDKKNHLEIWQDYSVLKNVSARVLLKKLSHQKTGDHTLYIFEAMKSGSYNKEYLTLDSLRDKKIIWG